MRFQKNSFLLLNIIYYYNLLANQTDKLTDLKYGIELTIRKILNSNSQIKIQSSTIPRAAYTLLIFSSFVYFLLILTNLFLMNRYLVLIFLFELTSAAELFCEYKTRTDWWAIDNVYYCDQDSDLFITKFNKNLTAINGRHFIDKSNSDIKGYRVYEKRLHYFPENLSNFFKNLEFIAIWDAELMEIHQKDLAPFIDLRIISIWKNKIKILEKNLFKFNTKLEYIGLGQNRIKHVEGRIFHHLKKLYSLHFDGNVCVSRQVGDDKHEVWDLVEEIEDQCSGYGD